MENRENLYRFLGRLYQVEVNQALLDQMESLCFPAECGEDELAQGYRLLAKYLQDLPNDALTDLAVDYARVFLGAGIVGDDAAYPYESVYTSSKRLIMQDARDQVLQIYRAKGLHKLEILDFPEDHITLELEFMAQLCQEAHQALVMQDWPVISDCLKEQLDFLTNHLLNWVPALCTDVEGYATTGFYKATAKITAGFLQLEQPLLANIMEEIGIVVDA